MGAEISDTSGGTIRGYGSGIRGPPTSGNYQLGLGLVDHQTPNSNFQDVLGPQNRGNGGPWGTLGAAKVDREYT